MASERVLVTIDPKQIADLKEFVRQEMAKDRADEAARQVHDGLRESLLALSGALEEAANNWPHDASPGEILEDTAAEIRRALR